MTKRPPKGVSKGMSDSGGTALPSKQEIVDFIATSEGKVGKREIARAFGIRGNDKIALKRLIGELGDDGTLAGDRKHLRQSGHLPAVATLDVTGRDVDGDLIAEPVEWDEDGPPPRVLITRVRDTPGEAAIGVGDRVLAKLTRTDPDQEDGAPYEASVIKRLPREKRRQLGIFRAAKGGGTIEPIDRKELRSFQVARQQDGGAKNGDLVRFETLRGSRLGPPQVRIQGVLGNPDDQRQISLIAVHAHGIPDDFPEAVIAETQSLAEPTLEGRTDLRELPLITIDPYDARDHDDAVHAAPDDDPKNPGGFVLTVAIADVAHFVRPFSRLDREAQLRGNSVYFPDRVVPMLPERISNDLCSLREGEERSVLVARMTFDLHGHKKRHVFLRVLMRSAAKLSYEEAQAAIDGKPSEKCVPLMDTALRPLWDAYGKLAAARDHRSPLDLDLPERKIRLDAHGRVARVERPERLDAHRLIEECMIQANVAAAETIEGKRGTVVYRIHDQPSKEKLKGLRDFLDSLDLKLPPDGQLTPAALNKVLAEAKRFPVPDLISEVVLRSQSQAEYNIENIGHFGLNLQRYAHFTSPIRRYADLLVHRALIRFCRLGEGGLEDDEVPRLRKLAEQISQAERRAMAAERETTDRLIAAHLADRIGTCFPARVAGVTRSGLFVRLKDTGADGFIPISSLADEYLIHVEAAHALTGQRSGKGYQLGDEVEVELLEAIPAAGALRFKMITPARALNLKPERGQGGKHLRRAFPKGRSRRPRR